MPNVNHKYEKLKLIRMEGKLIFSNTGSKKYCLKMGWHINMAGQELAKVGKVHGKLHGFVKAYTDSSHERFKNHEERSVGSAMSGGSSVDDVTNYTVRIFVV